MLIYYYRSLLVPDPPQNVRISELRATSAIVTWDAPPNDQIRGVIKKYIVRSTDNNGVIVYDGEPTINKTSCNISSLVPETNYSVKVAIENQRSKSVFSSIHFITRPGMILSCGAI